MAQIFMHHQALAAGYVHFVTRYCDRSQRENIPYTENEPELITISSRGMLVHVHRRSENLLLLNLEVHQREIKNEERTKGMAKRYL